MRPRSHEEIVEFGEGFIEICEIRINAINLDMNYFNLLANKEKKFNEKLYEKIIISIENEIEPDVNRYSNDYEETTQTVSELIKVARGRKKAMDLKQSANSMEKKLIKGRAELDNAYEEGQNFAMNESSLTDK